MVAMLSLIQAAEAREIPTLARLEQAPARNIVFILVDDQRYDGLSFMGHPFLETPAADALAKGGAHFQNAFVTTSLCSPSRATILTGLYAHSHGIIDNQSPISDEAIFFSEYLQQAGYKTAFIGKWHMGHEDAQKVRGWDHWVSFRGQGEYFPITKSKKRAVLNVDGQDVDQKTYITDELTDYAIRWLKQQHDGPSPWMLYLSHKAVHHDFSPAPRHQGRYADVKIAPFPTTKDTPLDALKPMWARNQRNSWHGGEFAFHGTEGKTEDIYRRYCEAMLAVDESTGKVMEYLKQSGQLDDTLVIYMGDNGHLWGEQSLIDKRTAYEASIRVPLIMHCPAIIPTGTSVKHMVANLDVAPTILEAAGLVAPDYFHGESLLPLARGEAVSGWREELVYEYFWERWAPSTPTLHALLTPKYKYVRAYGVWDVPELYALETDPQELHNLAASAEHRQTMLSMDKRLFELLKETEGDQMPLKRGWSGSAKELRDRQASEWADFPESMFANPSASSQP